MKPDWDDYSGPLCDDPAELDGLDYVADADGERLEPVLPGDWLFTRDDAARKAAS